MNKTAKIIIGVLIVIIIALVARFIIFDKKFDEFGEQLQRIEVWQKEYKETHPDATDKEVDEAFNKGIENIEVWKENYKKDNPDATNEEIETAFKELFE